MADTWVVVPAATITGPTVSSLNAASVYFEPWDAVIVHPGATRLSALVSSYDHVVSACLSIVSAVCRIVPGRLFT